MNVQIKIDRIILHGSDFSNTDPRRLRASVESELRKYMGDPGADLTSRLSDSTAGAFGSVDGTAAAPPIAAAVYDRVRR
jgi:hypothetical protein